MGQTIFSTLVTFWIAWGAAYDPPATYGGLIVMRICGTINGLAGIVGCLSIMYGKPDSTKKE